MAESHVRIDEGIKRGPRHRTAPPNPTDKATGRFLPAVSIEQRRTILGAAIHDLRMGSTTEEIAAQHSISPRTLRHWLIADESANEARAEFLTGKVVQCAEQIEEADGPLPLARAREAFRSWSWLAERRNSQMFGPKQEVTVDVRVSIESSVLEDADALLSRYRGERVTERVIEHNADSHDMTQSVTSDVVDAPQLLDSTLDTSHE